MLPEEIFATEGLGPPFSLSRGIIDHAHTSVERNTEGLSTPSNLCYIGKQILQTGTLRGILCANFAMGGQSKLGKSHVI